MVNRSKSDLTAKDAKDAKEANEIHVVYIVSGQLQPMKLNT